MTNFTTITGNGGEVVIREDGTIIDYYPSEEVKAGEHDGYADIKSFDTSEFRAFYMLASMPASVDILDIGYFHERGYEPPQEEFRLLADDARQTAGLKASAYDKWEMSGPEEGDKIDTRVFVTYDGQEIFEITEGSTAKMKSIARRIAKLMNEGKAGLC